MVIDAHVHFWEYNKQQHTWINSDMKELQQNYLPQNITTTLQRNGVAGCVAIQAHDSEVETLFLYELSKTHPFIKGVVGWVDMMADNVAERLQYFSQHTIIKGFRYGVLTEPDSFLLQKNFESGIAAMHQYNYTFDLLVCTSKLKDAIALVSKFPEQLFVLNHLALPAVEEKKIEEWNVLIKEIALHQNVHCKLSGLFTEARWKQWSPGDFYPYLDVVFEAFGTQRLMFGSDWPVMLLSGMYVQWKSLLEKYMQDFKEEKKLQVFGSNAIAFYSL
jgi:L-fuconolactonase